MGSNTAANLSIAELYSKCLRSLPQGEFLLFHLAGNMSIQEANQRHHDSRLA